jgi:hypothetical protein
MSWLNSLFNRSRTENIEVELLGETEKSIKVKYGVSTTYIPKILIRFERVKEDNITKVRLPRWL